MANDPMPGSAVPSDPTPEAEPVHVRLERIETALAILSAEVVVIRAELRGSAFVTPSAGHQDTAPHRSRPRHQRADQALKAPDFERLLGQYGMLVIAVFAAVAAVGTFLSWAISRGLLAIGPEARVSISVAAAIGLGAWGLRLRRTERSFGSSVVGLALVIMHVSVYAAGPRLHLVPAPAAFAVIAFLSWAIALFAYAEGDEPLWCVGFGGAAVAPFVATGGSGNLDTLLAYGLLVLLPACFAISHRDWPVGWRVFYAIAALYTVAGVGLISAQSGGERERDLLLTLAFPFALAIGGIVPFAPEQRKRGILRWLGVLAAIVALSAYDGQAGLRHGVADSLIAAMALWLFLLDRHADVAQSTIMPSLRGEPVLEWIDAAVLPMVFVLQALGLLAGSSEWWPVLFAACVLITLFAWRRPLGRLRDASAFAAMMAAFGLVAVLQLEEPVGRVTAFVALGLAGFCAHRARPSLSWLATGTFVLLAGGALSIRALVHRPIYEFTPFVTEPSASALAVAVALSVVARYWNALRVATRVAMGARPEWTYAESMRRLLRAVALAPWLWVFLWIVIELSMAFSPSTSTLLLVIYFAGTAVACVAAGRARHAPRLRQTGLGLALGAAATAVYGASTYFDTGARIAAYLVTSAFLLGIAYWYRRPGSRSSDAVAPAGEV